MRIKDIVQRLKKVRNSKKKDRANNSAKLTQALYFVNLSVNTYSFHENIISVFHEMNKILL